MQKQILITGDAGYIGSHTALQLLHEGYAVTLSTQRLWGVPHWRAGCISRFAPDGRLLRRIGVPTSSATNVCFAGPGFDGLFVKTRRFELEGAELLVLPHARVLCEVVERGLSGLPSLPAGLGGA